MIVKYLTTTFTSHSTKLCFVFVRKYPVSPGGHGSERSGRATGTRYPVPVPGTRSRDDSAGYPMPDTGDRKDRFIDTEGTRMPTASTARRASSRYQVPGILGRHPAALTAALRLPFPSPSSAGDQLPRGSRLRRWSQLRQGFTCNGGPAAALAQLRRRGFRAGRESATGVAAAPGKQWQWGSSCSLDPAKG